MPFPRMTTRRWMIAVVLVALLLGGTITARRCIILRQDYLQRAAYHDDLKGRLFNHPDSPTYWEFRWRDQRAGLKGAYPWPDGPPFVSAIAEYHDRMAMKWRYAADHPWVEVEPDPVANGP